MKKFVLFTGLWAALSLAHAETTTAPAAAPVTTPAAVSTVPTTAATATPKAAVKPKTTATTEATVPVVPTAEQRRQQELLANAERIDQVNRDLLAQNQELTLQNENLNLQNHVLQRDKSTEGIWKGAAAVIVGFLMGWFFAGSRKKRSW